MSAEWNVAVVRRIVDGINRWDPFIFQELYHPEVVDRDPLVNQGPGANGIKQAYIRCREAFPDMHITIEDLIAQGDKVAMRYTLRGTHQGEFEGIPATWRKVTITGIDIYRFSDGKVVEWWHRPDTLALLAQLGAFPS